MIINRKAEFDLICYKRYGEYVYSTQKSFSFILIVVVTFTVVIFGQIQCQKKFTFTVFLCHVYSLLVRSSLFGHLNQPLNDLSSLRI